MYLKYIHSNNNKTIKDKYLKINVDNTYINKTRLIKYNISKNKRGARVNVTSS
nr:MAG TPA: hypothetical protein [Caudoviricetes sp.]